MTHPRGALACDYGAPLFLAWQLTNRCACRCLHCCEDSGPDKAWPGELTRARALGLAREIGEMGIPYVAFGGGEPMAVPHVWEIFEALRRGGVSIKIETDGLLIDGSAVKRLKDLAVSSLQISVDGAKAETHEKVRPGGSFKGAMAAVERTAAAGLEPEVVFIPTRINVGEAAALYDSAVKAGARRFVSGPLMRLGRAWQSWSALAPSEREWKECVRALNEAAARHKNAVELSLYPWDILGELKSRKDSPQAMMLVVPDGHAKLLNALPFAPATLQEVGLAEAWRAVSAAWRSPQVLSFIDKALADPGLLRHANECWALPSE